MTLIDEFTASLMDAGTMHRRTPDLSKAESDTGENIIDTR